jgi:16S rRNA pseudouridine516 synthase
MKIRIDRMLATGGYGSRRDIKRLLRDRRLFVNGTACVDPSIAVDPETDSFELDGKKLTILTSVYLMLNKPADTISSTDDPKHRTVIDCLDAPYSRMELFPVGRLDIDTEGLLIITNDGPLTHRLTSPKTGVDKTYFAHLRDPVDDATLADYARRFSDGIAFRDGTVCLPAKITRADVAPAADGSVGDAPAADAPIDEVLITIQEGKYHQVKNMMKVVGNEVAYLKRVSMGQLALDPSLAPGAYRALTDDEVELLRHQ